MTVSTAYDTNSRPRYRRPPAFTLVELLCVVVIIGIVSSALLMRLGPQSVGNPGARAAARRLSLDLRHARSLAIAEGVNHFVDFDAAGSDLTGYTIYRENGGSGVAVESYRSFDRGVTASAAVSRVEFDPSGAALAGCSVTISGPTQAHTVTVIAATGTTIVSGP